LYFPQALAAIKRERFHSNVYGPLGVHITLKAEHKNFGPAVERSLWRVLNCFLVDNPEDRNKLVGILKAARIDSVHPIITQQPGPRFVMQGHGDFTVMADCVSVEEDIVFNALVDQCNIDQVVVVSDERESDAM
jgi:chromosome segregation ATPase